MYLYSQIPQEQTLRKGKSADNVISVEQIDPSTTSKAKDSSKKLVSQEKCYSLHNN